MSARLPSPDFWRGWIAGRCDGKAYRDWYQRNVKLAMEET